MKNDTEYLEIVNEILNHEEFNKLKNSKHHGINRYDHCVRVSYWSYKFTKKLHMDYKSIARAGLLHDFFLINNQELKFFPRVKVLITHPKLALENSKKYFDVNKLEENIIITHMFPINLRVPTRLASWIVDTIDNIASIYERLYSFVK